MRLKGTGQRWPLSYISIFWYAVKAAEKARTERIEKRKSRP
jgi:hypothetical protein